MLCHRSLSGGKPYVLCSRSKKSATGDAKASQDKMEHSLLDNYVCTSFKILKWNCLSIGGHFKSVFDMASIDSILLSFRCTCFRYDRNYTIEGKPYEGHDRHNGEIVAFHLNRYYEITINEYIISIFSFENSCLVRALALLCGEYVFECVHSLSCDAQKIRKLSNKPASSDAGYFLFKNWFWFQYLSYIANSYFLYGLTILMTRGHNPKTWLWLHAMVKCGGQWLNVQWPFNLWLAMMGWWMIYHAIWLNLLSRLLGYRRVPLTVGRVIDLEKEILPVATERLRVTFFKNGICCLLLHTVCACKNKCLLTFFTCIHMSASVQHVSLYLTITEILILEFLLYTSDS